MMNYGHVKVLCRIDEIHSDGTMTFVADVGNGYEGIATIPIPNGWNVVEGQLFTVHRTKSGKIYHHLIDKPVWTKKELKRVKKEAAKLRAKLGMDDE